MHSEVDSPLVPCGECGYGVAPDAEFCPDCGLRQQPAAGLSRWDALVRKAPPARTDHCLRSLEAQLAADLAALDEELGRFEQQFAALGARIDEAVAAQRSAAPLERARAGLASGLSQRRRLRARYLASAWDLAVDRYENELALLLQEAATDGPAVALDLPLAHTLATRVVASRCVALSTDARWLAAASPEGTAALWELDSDTEVAAFTGKPFNVRALAVAGLGNKFACLAKGLLGLGARLYDAASHKEVGFGTRASVCLALNPGGWFLVCGRGDGELRVFDALSPKRPVGVVPPPGEAAPAVTALAFSDDGETLAAGDAAGGLRLIAPLEWQPTASLGEGGAAISQLAFAPHGRQLLVRRADVVELWDVRQRVCVARLPVAANCAALSADGRFIALGVGAKLELWRTAPPARVGTFAGHETEVLAVACAPSGGLVRSVALDGSVKTWRTARVADPFGEVRAIVQAALAALRSDALTTVTADTGPLRRRTEALLLTTSDTFSRLLSLRAAALARLTDPEALADEARRLLAETSTALGTSSALAPELPQALADLLDELPARTLGALVDELLHTVETAAADLQHADEADCTARLAVLASARERAAELARQVAQLPPASAARPLAQALRAALDELARRLPGIEDSVLARESLAALGTLAPLADKGQVAALARLRGGLRPLLAAPALALGPAGSAAFEQRSAALQALGAEARGLGEPG